MRDNKSGGNKESTKRSPVRGIQMECSVLFAYTLDAQDRPEVWDVRLISDRDCGTRLEIFRKNADSNGKFVPTPPKHDHLERIYKLQIQDDGQGFCSPLGDYGDCLFLLETVPTLAFDFGTNVTGGVLEFGGAKTLCGTRTFRSFDAKLLLAPLLAPFGHALWRFKAEIAKNASLLEWKKFSFSSRETDTFGSPISGDVSFLKPAQQRLRNSLEAALNESEQTPGRQWDFPIDDTKPSGRSILSHLGAVLSSFPARLGGSTIGQGQGLKVGLALFSVLEKDSKNQISLKIVSLPAGKDKLLAKASIFDYRSLPAENRELQSIGESDTAKLRLLAQSAATLSPGPRTTGSLQDPVFSKPYFPYRKSILELHSIPTWTFTKFWNSYAEQQLGSLRLTQAGNPVSFVPRFVDLSE